MTNRFIWFGAGTVVGAVLLYLLLWTGGVLSPYLAQVRAHLPPAAEVAPAANAEVKMVSPIQGLKASDIRDSFKEGRPGGHPHEATDIMEPRGTPVHAMVDGTIRKLFVSKAGGLTIYEFDQTATYCYYYAHLHGYAEGIAEGQHVSRGTVIGYVGSTGNASANAPHLHLGIDRIGPEKHWWGGTPVDPYPILLKLLK